MSTRIWYLVLVPFLIMLPGIALLKAPSAQQGRPDNPYRIKVNANLVLLHATVKDAKGIPISGLDQDNFQVYEDGALQQISYFSHDDIPVTVGLLIDNSGSMRRKRTEIMASALAFARSSNPQDQMFVINFNEHVRFALPDNTPFTDKVSELRIALSTIITNGQTALYDAVAAGIDHLSIGDRDKKVLIVISDGGDNASHHNLRQVMALAQQADAIIYTIGFFDDTDEDRDLRVLRKLARETGGEAFLPRSLKETVPTCERIARDIRNQYTIAYVPTNKRQDGTYRTIQVKTSTPGRRHLLVRTRAGYRAPLAPQPSPVVSYTPRSQ